MLAERRAARSVGARGGFGYRSRGADGLPAGLLTTELAAARWRLAGQDRVRAAVSPFLWHRVDLVRVGVVLARRPASRPDRRGDRQFGCVKCNDA